VPRYCLIVRHTEAGRRRSRPGRIGIVTSQMLKEKRRYFIVIAFVIAAVLTPPDVLSQMSLAIPLMILYEGSIWSVRMVEGKRGTGSAATGTEVKPAE
jgi:sec-independent protein translocase protein TatC